MEKVYLLLRKNQQTGPYTYEELLQQQLSPTDLIWVEGKSTIWMNPEEVKQLTAAGAAIKPSSPEATGRREQDLSSRNAPTTDNIPWYLKKKSPEAELEERALAIRTRAQAAAAEQAYRPTPPMRTSRKQVVYQEEESPILLEVHTINKKSVTLPQLIAAGVITALVATGWYNREVLNIVRPQHNAVTQAAAPAVFQVSLPTPPKPSLVAVEDTNMAPPQEMVEANTRLATVSVARTKQPTPQVEEVKETPVATSETAAAPPLTPPAVAEKKEESKTKMPETAPVEKKQATEAIAKEPTNDKEVEQTATNKKKGLGQAIKNIFKKKKKNEDKSEDGNGDTE